MDKRKKQQPQKQRNGNNQSDDDNDKNSDYERSVNDRNLPPSYLEAAVGKRRLQVRSDYIDFMQNLDERGSVSSRKVTNYIEEQNNLRDFDAFINRNIRAQSEKFAEERRRNEMDEDQQNDKQDSTNKNTGRMNRSMKEKNGEIKKNENNDDEDNNPDKRYNELLTTKTRDGTWQRVDLLKDFINESHILKLVSNEVGKKSIQRLEGDACYLLLPNFRKNFVLTQQYFSSECIRPYFFPPGLTKNYLWYLHNLGNLGLCLSCIEAFPEQDYICLIFSYMRQNVTDGKFQPKPWSETEIMDDKTFTDLFSDYVRVNVILKHKNELAKQFHKHIDGELFIDPKKVFEKNEYSLSEWEFVTYFYSFAR